VGVAVSHQFYTGDGYYHVAGMAPLLYIQALHESRENLIKSCSSQHSVNIGTLDVIIAIIWTTSDPLHFQLVDYKIKSGQSMI
jgi:hypothetical protein